MGGQGGQGTNIETSRQTEQWRLPCLSSHPPLNHNQLTDWNGVFTIPTESLMETKATSLSDIESYKYLYLVGPSGTTSVQCRPW